MRQRIGVALVVCLMTSAAALAGDWKEDHPRRAQVNSRLNHQNQRINEGAANGQLTKNQARQLHAEDHAIRQQERADAAANGGHVTKGEQRQLNREENRVSEQIYQEKH